MDNVQYIRSEVEAAVKDLKDFPEDTEKIIERLVRRTVNAVSNQHNQATQQATADIEKAILNG